MSLLRLGWEWFRRRPVLIAAAGGLALSTVPEAFLVLWAHQGGLRLAWIPLLWAAAHAAKAVVSVPAGMLADRLGRLPVVGAGWTLRVLLLAGFAWLPDGGATVWGLFLAYAAALAFTEGAERALLGDLAPPAQRASVYGLYHLLTGVLALPGDSVTFHAPGVPLGLLVEGEPVVRKAAAPLRVALRGERPAHAPPALALRATAYETVGDRRFRILLDPDAAPPAWRALDLPPADAGPVQVVAEGYLVLADNRVEGACCDSRALGWIDPDAVRGEVVARLSAPPAATPDLAPEARGLQWSP